MRNCIVLGSGRSGTSLTAGLLHGAGYHCGASLIEARDTNPRGFYEDHLVNFVNERIMAGGLGLWRRPRWLHRLTGRRWYGPGQLWLKAIEEPVHWRPDELCRLIIPALVANRPFAYKDPRFCYTLDAWRPWLGDCRFVVVFRDPATTAASILREVTTEPWYRGLRYTAEDALALWTAMYRQVLDVHCTDPGNWFFVDYADLVSGAALPSLSRFLDVVIEPGFADPALRRSAPAPVPVPAAAAELHRRLGERAAASLAGGSAPAAGQR